MKRSLLPIIIILLMALQKTARAQYVLKEADAQYELFNYTNAIDLYEQAYKKKATLYAAERLGASYAAMHNYKQTESWYAIAASMPGTSITNHLQYARALQNNSKYTEAKAVYLKYAQLDSAVTAAQRDLWISSCDSALKWMKNPGIYTVKNKQELNSEQADWGAVKYNNVIVYASDRGPQGTGQHKNDRPFLKFDGANIPDKNRYNWTGNQYLKLYMNDSTARNNTPFPLVVEKGYHVGAASFSADGREIFFSLTKIPKYPEYNKARLATVHVGIYTSTKSDTGSWNKPRPFRYNNMNEWSVGDPCLSMDGKTLFFVSDMPGGKGGTDLYVSHLTKEGWAPPINLVEINTMGNERSPAFDHENNFYFSSDGYQGMGGLDIFKTANRGGIMDVPQNLGYPINSPQDDFAFMPTSTGSGYFSSDRPDGMGEDDIYSFNLQQGKSFQLNGVAYDKKSQAPLSNVVVSLIKRSGGALKVQTGTDGVFRFNLDPTSTYQLIGEKTNYRSDQVELAITNFDQPTSLSQNLYLEAIQIDKPIRLENIYYDFDKANIRPDAAIELNKLIAIMKENPTIWIELGSHTDSRGNDQYNQWLSQSRANAAVQYIIDNGINKNRITAKGYGERMPVNQCINGAKCTEADYQLNRRTEFKIVKQ